MNKSIANELKAFVKEVEGRYSNKERERNFNGEDFQVKEVYPVSDHVAVVEFQKSSGKMALALFYYIPNGMSKGWRYFFPTDSHLTGFRAFEAIKLWIEKKNYKFNFDEEK